MSLLDKSIVLKLNAAWQPIGWSTVKDAFISMCGMPGGTPPALALDIELDEKGNLLTAIATKWDDWIKLPVRPNEPSIATKNGSVRVPLVLIDGSYSEMPHRAPKFTNRGVLERDGYLDQYTGEKLVKTDATVDHVIPKDVWRRRGLKGSPNTWTNVVACKKDRNHKKGNKLNAAAGLVLQKRPKAPKPIPVSFLIKGPKHPIHAPFLVVG